MPPKQQQQKKNKQPKKKKYNKPERPAHKKHAKVIRAKVASGTKNQQLLAQAIALPYTVQRRLPEGNTATALMRATQSVGFAQRLCATPGTGFAAGDAPVVLLGFPGLNAAYWDTFYLETASNVGDARCLESIYFSAETNTVMNSTFDWNLVPSTDGNVSINLDTGSSGEVVLSDAPIVWPIWTTVTNRAFGAYSEMGDHHGPNSPIGESNGYPYVFLNKGDALVLNNRLILTTSGAWSNPFALHVSVSFRAYNAVGMQDTNREVQINHRFLAPAESGALKQFYTYYYATTACWICVTVDSISVSGAAATLEVALPKITILTMQARIYRNINNSILLVNTDSSQASVANLWLGADGFWNPVHGPDAGSYSCWRLVTSTMFNTLSGGDPLIAQSVRTVGSSLLITNMSPEAAQGGNFHCARVKGGLWHSWGMDRLRGAAGYSANMKCKDGVYTFIVPEKERMQFQNTIPAPFNASPRVNLDLLVDTYAHYIVVGSASPLLMTQADLQLGTNVVAPSRYRFTLDEQFEFETSSRRYHVTTATDHYADIQDVLRMFCNNDVFFYENPLHLEKLYTMLKGVASKAWRGFGAALPYAAPAIVAANPSLAPLVAALKGLTMVT